MPLCYDRHFESIGVARHREGNWTCSLLRDNTTFMKLQYGSMKAYFKLACTFFQFGRLVATSIEKTPGGYRLGCEQEWGYVRPLPGIQQPDWWKIDRNLREKANWQRHRWQVDVAFTKNGLTLHIGTEGTPNIPAKLECILPPGGLVHSGRLTVPAQPGGWLIAGQDASYDRGGEVMRLSGGFNMHNYAPNMRNSDPQPTDQFCLYCTDFTPMDRQLEISFDA